MTDPTPEPVFTPCLVCPHILECRVADECLEPSSYEVGLEQDPRWENE